MSGIKYNLVQRENAPDELQPGVNRYVEHPNGQVDHYIGTADGTPILISSSQDFQLLADILLRVTDPGGEMYVPGTMETGDPSGTGAESIKVVMSGMDRVPDRVQVVHQGKTRDTGSNYDDGSLQVGDQQQNDRVISRHAIGDDAEGQVDIHAAQVAKDGSRDELSSYVAKFELFVYGLFY